MKDAKQILLDFIEEKTSIFNGFKTKTGQQYEGWIECVDGDDIIIRFYGPMNDNSEPMRFPINDIDIYTLVYYDEAIKGRVEFGKRLKEREG